MGKTANPIEKLAGLLAEAGAKPQVIRARLAPSPTYDLEYRFFIVAMIFEKFARPFESGTGRRMLASKLKLLQFVTLRPWLLPAIREWSDASAQGELELTHSVKIRRGFLSDTAHEDLVNFMEACGVLNRSGDHVLSGQESAELGRILGIVAEHDLFANENKIITELASIRVTRNMLEGW